VDTADQTEAATGSAKNIPGDMLATTDRVGQVLIKGGGTIELGGHTFTVAGAGTLDLANHTLTMASGGTLTLANHNLTLDGDARFNLQGVTIGLNAAKDDMTIDGVELAKYDPNGSINLGGKALTFSAGVLTIDASDIDMDQVVEWADAAAPNGELVAADANGDLVRSKLVRTGSGVLTLGSPSSDITFSVNQAGGISLGGDTLTFAGGVLTIGSSNVDMDQAVEWADAASPNGTLITADSNGDLVNSKVKHTGTGILTLASPTTNTTLAISESGTLKLGGKTLDMNGSVRFEGPELMIFKDGGTLTMNNQRLTLTGTGTLDLGLSRKLSVKSGNATLKFAGHELSLDSNTILSGEGHRLTLRGGNTMLENGGTLKVNGHGVIFDKSGNVAFRDEVTPFLAIVNFGLDYKWSGSGAGKKYPKSILFDPASYPSGATFKIKMISKKLVAGSATFTLYSGPIDAQTGATTLGSGTVNYEPGGGYWSGGFTFTPPTEKRLFIIQAQSSDVNTYELVSFQMEVSK
jgi:hypothetical protein